MRKLLILLILLISSLAWAGSTTVVVGQGSAAGGGYATPAFVTGNGQYNYTEPEAVTAAQSTTTGNAIIVIAVNYSGTTAISTVTDTASNTYTKIGGQTDGDGNVWEIWADYDITGNAANVVTATYAASGRNVCIWAIQVSGLAASGYDKEAVAYAYTSSAFSVGATAATTQNDEYVLAVGYNINDPSRTYTAGSGYTERYDSGGAFIEDKVVTSTGAQTATATLSGSATVWMGCIVTFKAKAL